METTARSSASVTTTVLEPAPTVRTTMAHQMGCGWRSRAEAGDNCREGRHIASSNSDCKVSNCPRHSSGKRGVLFRFSTRWSLKGDSANDYSSRMATVI